MATQLYLFQDGQAIRAEEGVEQHRRQTGFTEKSMEIQKWEDEGGKIPSVPIVKIAPEPTHSAWETFGEDDINE